MVIRSIPHGGPTELFLIPKMMHNWCSKGRGMYCPVCGMVHIKHTLLLIGKSSPSSGSCGFPLAIFVVRYHMSDAM